MLKKLSMGYLAAQWYNLEEWKEWNLASALILFLRT